MAKEQEALDKILRKHLPYELDMLRSTFEQLRAIAGKPDHDVIRNALIESFCVHARSLLDFFSNRMTHNDDAVAQDFSPRFTTTLDPEKEPLKTLKKKLNKKIFHLAKMRAELDNFDVFTDGLKAMETIENARKEFEEERTLIKCKTAPLENLSVPSFPGSGKTTTLTKPQSLLSSPPAFSLSVSR